MVTAKCVELEFDDYIFDNMNVNHYKESLINYNDEEMSLVCDLGFKLELPRCLKTFNEVGHFDPLYIYDPSDVDYNIPVSFTGIITTYEVTPSINSYIIVNSQENNFKDFLTKQTKDLLDKSQIKYNTGHWNNLDKLLSYKNNRIYKNYLLENSYDIKTLQNTKTNSYYLTDNSEDVDNYISVKIENNIGKSIYFINNNELVELTAFKESYDEIVKVTIHVVNNNIIVDSDVYDIAIADILEHKYPIYFDKEECLSSHKDNKYEEDLVKVETELYKNKIMNKLEILEQKLFNLKENAKDIRNDRIFTIKLKSLEESIYTKKENLDIEMKLNDLTSMLNKENDYKLFVSNTNKLLNTAIKGHATHVKIKNSSSKKSKED